MDVQWNALMGAPNPGQAFAESYERGRQQRRAEHIQNQQLGWQREQQGRQRGEWQRADNLRSATAEMLLQGRGGRQSNALMGQLPGTSTSANPADAHPEQPTARERAIRADPSAFLTFEGKCLEVTADQLKNYRDLNDYAMQLLGGVVDQPTYDAAKVRAGELYKSFGHDASEFLAGLPPEYSADTVRSLQMQGMDTSKQMAAIASENRLEWDIEDDVADNERADRNTSSLINYRTERLKDADAAEAGRDRRANRPRAGKAPKEPSPNSVIGRIMDKEARGEILTPGETKVYTQWQAGKGRVRGRAASGPVAVGPNGERLIVRNGQWVDERTGRAVQ